MNVKAFSACVMKRVWIPAFLTWLSIGAMAQVPCDEKELASRPGLWKERMKGSTSGIPAGTVEKEKAIIGKIHGMVKESYTPVGLAALYGGAYGLNGSYDGLGAKSWIGLPYYYAIHFLKYWCDPRTNKELVNGEGETSTTLYLYANSMEWICPIGAHALNAGDFPDGWAVMPYKAVKKDGHYFFDLLREPRSGSRYEAWLVTTGDQLPFLYVSRQEYLEKQKAKLETQKQKNIEDITAAVKIRPAAEQEAAKQKGLDYLKGIGAGPNRIKSYLDDWKTDEQQRDEQIQMANQSLAESLENINEYLGSAGGSEGQEPAIVKSQELNSGFSGFGSEGAGVYLVKPNLDYYDKKRPQSAPQFFAVFFKTEEGNTAVYARAFDEIQKAVRIEFLKSLLGNAANEVTPK